MPGVRGRIGVLQAEMTAGGVVLASTTPGSSGAKSIGASAISGWAGADVQTILEAAKVYVDARGRTVARCYLNAGNIAASIASAVAMFGDGAGAITMAGFQLATTGTDASNPLTLEMDVKIGGTSIFTTKPKISKTAAAGASTFTAGTGITVGVIDAAHKAVVLGSVITWEAAIVRTASPSVEMANATFYIEITYPAP